MAPKISFRRTVHRTIALLERLGYQLSAAQPMPEVVQYSKTIAPNITCHIDFQLRQFFKPPIRQFDVILSRHRTSGVKGNELHYAPLNISLWQFMWLIHGVQVDPVTEQWKFISDEDLQDQLLRAQTLLLDFGIPWLEDPSTRVPSEVPASERKVFLTVLENTGAQELESLGYTLETVMESEEPCFVKIIRDDLKIFIEFRHIRIVHPPNFEVEEYQLDVRLKRGVGSNIYESKDITSPFWLDTSLGAILWSEFGVYPGEFIGWEPLYKYVAEEEQRLSIKIPPTTAYVWRYIGHAQLEERLWDITEKLKRYAIPWLENLEVDNP